MDKILQLNLLKTDFYREEVYPTFLYYNPYASNQSVTIDVGATSVDLYDVLSETFLLQNVSGNIDFIIPADQAVELVLVPVGGTISYELNKMLINNVVVDYMQTSQVYNSPPRIKSLAATNNLLEVGDSTTIYATASDKEGEVLTYRWGLNGEQFTETGETITWTALTIGNYQIVVTVADEQLNETSKSIDIEVVDHINTPPIIIDMFSNINNINPLEEVEITCVAEDADNDALTYSWSTNAGTISGAGSTVVWKSPAADGIFEVNVVVNDGNNGVVESKLNFLVKDYSVVETDNPIAYYPFAGNANNMSGNKQDGQVFGAVLTDDFEGNADNAYYFDGSNDYIKVENAAVLNFTQAITVSCWIRPENLLSGKESFILSHGSWQNRWKLSINSGKVRWTINTSSSIKDVDSSNGLEEDESYHITATYDGTYAILYINGKFDSSTKLEGLINTTTYDFLMGRMLTDDDNTFNYTGLIDEVLIYDYALNPEEAMLLIGAPIINGIYKAEDDNSITIYPNPTKGEVYLNLEASFSEVKSIEVYNVYGKMKLIDFYINTDHDYVLDFSNFSNGIYYISIGLSNRRISKRIIVSE